MSLTVAQAALPAACVRAPRCCCQPAQVCAAASRPACCCWVLLLGGYCWVLTWNALADWISPSSVRRSAWRPSWLCSAPMLKATAAFS